MRDFEAVIGLEVHAQLQTASKAFSPDSAAFGGDPNTHVDVISLAHPGTLPIPNRKHVESAVALGLATGCEIAPVSIMARKHYFYPDLPKGYQISQYDRPICENGAIEIEWKSSQADGGEIRHTKTVRLIRIHLEEDAGKSIHNRDPFFSLIDVNRCGVPLVEIVSHPDMTTPREAFLFLKKIRQLVRYLGICDGNMEEGSMRCDANISIRPKGEQTLGTKTELKNLNSFRNVERALEYEIARQIRIVRKGGIIQQETLLWDADEGVARSMRSKEEAHDYRYFPDPDLPPVIVSEQTLDSIRSSIPELPDRREARFLTEFELPLYDSQVLTDEKETADYFESVLKHLDENTSTSLAEKAKAVSNVVMTEVLRVVNESNGDWSGFPIGPDRLAQLVSLRLSDEISSSGLQSLFDEMLRDGGEPNELAKRLNLLQVQDQSVLIPVIEQVLADNPDEVAAYRSGKKQLIGFFMGQVMRGFPGSPDPRVVRSGLLDKLEK